MKATVITHPKGERFVQLRAGYQAITGNDCAAMLLSVFEHWTNYKSERGDALWIYKSSEDLSSEMLGLYSPRTIKKELKLLLSLKLLQKRTNPRHKWDRTYQYLLNVGQIQTELNSWAAKQDIVRARDRQQSEHSSDLPNEKMHTIGQNYPLEGADLPQPPGSSTPAIPQDTSQEPIQDISIAADAARPSAEVDPRVRLPGENLQEHMDRIRARVRERASVPPAPPAAPAPAPDPAPAAKKASKKPKAPPKPKAEPKERARNLMFDAVAPHVAGSSDETAIRAAAGQIARVVKYLQPLDVTPEQVPLLAEYIQVNCFVSRQPRILYGSWEKFTASWISAGKGGAKTLADRLMERYEQPRPEVADDPDDDFDYSDGGNLLL